MGEFKATRNVDSLSCLYGRVHRTVSLCSLKWDCEVLLVNRSGRPQNVAQSISPLGADDVCTGRVDCMPDMCLQQFRADRKAFCVRPSVTILQGTSTEKGRKRPVGCHIRSMSTILLLSLIKQNNKKKRKKRWRIWRSKNSKHSLVRNSLVFLHCWVDGEVVSTQRALIS